MAGGTKMYSVLPTEIMKQLAELGENLDNIVDDMLDVGTDEILPEAKRNLKAAVTKGYATGGLENSVTVKKVSGRARGLSYKGRLITFEGKSNYQKDKSGRLRMRKKPVRNNEIAAVLEYGKSDQPARPFLRTAFIAKESAAREVMERKFDEKTKKYQN